jgi:WD40 repeat protein
MAASCSYDGTIRLWSILKPQEQPVIINDDHGSWVYGIAFTPDGDRLASGSSDKTVKIRTVIAALLAKKVCPAVKRNMTKEEWEKYVGTDIPYNETCPGKK